ncbi:LysR substrate-binding domain-containing protein [Sphingomonas sp. AP4-R1]|uniref:LysR substrate-binding domain-containing protein n=1 Tax=Sphingomonas sp. AP4-R1 TaxID=2735134 RepID=UPI0020A27A6E|nr:LysR substrate-binding domain-containing protein [Sphingomonas sp. AP4-R1]
MGTALFKRSVTGLELTHAGQLVADYSDVVVMGFDSLRSDLDDIKGSSRLIRLMMVESVVSAGPAQAIAEFGRKFENVQFEFEIVPAPAVVDAVRSQKCDMGITFCAEVDSAINVIARVPEPLLALVPWGHPLGQVEHLPLGDLTRWRVALPTRDFGVRRIFDRACAQANVLIRPHLQSNSFEALRDFVRSGVGIAILPKRAALREAETQRAHCVPLAGQVFGESTLDLISYRQQRTPRLVRLFVDTLRQSIEAHH